MRGILLFVLPCILACKHEPPPPAELVAVDALCTDPKYDSHMDQKTALEVMPRVTVEGMLDIPRGIVTLCSQRSCQATLLPLPGSAAKPLMISLDIGDDPGQMNALPDHYAEKDLAIHATGGKILGVGAKVRVTGKRLGTTTTSCSITNVDRVDAL